MAQILIVDDDRSFAEALADTLVDFGHGVDFRSSVEAALQDSGSPDLAFLDLNLPGESGMEFLRRTKCTFPIIVLTAFADSENTIEAIRLGAFDHLTKPIGRDELQAIVDRALVGSQALPTKANSVRAGALIGQSVGIREVQKRIGIAASGEMSVLIEGETGTGKELVARSIHRHSSRRLARFVAVNCAAIPRELVESELFGHVRGAFTGAARTRSGSFVDADGGTLFLDEIGDMELPVQAKLLRVLQEKVVVPVGSSDLRRVNVRIIAATHRRLTDLIDSGAFRPDLFFRINALRIGLPPLRERGEDVLLLADHLLTEAVGGTKLLSPAARQKLLQHSWPGNVRELENVIRSAAFIARAALIQPAEIEFSANAGSSTEPSLEELDWQSAMHALEHRLLLRALRQSGGNRSEAARMLKIHRQFLYTKLKEHGLGEPGEGAA